MCGRAGRFVHAFDWLGDSVKREHGITSVSVAVAVLCLALTSIGNRAILHQAHGWDAQLYCQAAESDAAGRDPYQDTHLARGFSWTYPPLLLNVFGIACRWTPVFSSYPIVYLAVLLLCVPLWRVQPRDWPLAVACAYGIFAGAVWGLESGNVEILFAIPVSLAFHSVSRRNYGRAAAWLSILAAIKLLPVVYFSSFLFLQTSWRERVRAVSVGVGCFVLVWTILTFGRPALAPSYLRQVTGTLPSQYAAALEVGHITQPAFPYFIGQILKWPNEVQSLVRTEPIALACVALLVVGAITLTRREPDSLARGETLFAFSFLAVHLVLPRLKPYTFALMAPAVFYLFKRQGEFGRSVMLLIGAAWPVIALLHVITPWAFIPAVLLTYHQTLALLGTLTLFVALEADMPGRRVEGRGAGTPVYEN